MKPNWTIYAARAIAIAWAGFWMWFGIASGIGEKEGVVNLLVHITMPGAIAMVTALAAWRWPVHGGSLLVAEGLLVGLAMAAGVLHPPNLNMAMFLVGAVALPPIVAGLLFLGGGRMSSPSRIHT